MKSITKYLSIDGKEFLCKENCIDYEKKNNLYPYIEVFQTKLLGDLDLDYIEVIEFNNEKQKIIDKYYQYKDIIKFHINNKLSFMYKLPLINNKFGQDFSLFFINLFCQIPNIQTNELIQYIEYYKRHIDINGNVCKDFNNAAKQPIRYDIKYEINSAIKIWDKQDNIIIERLKTIH